MGEIKDFNCTYDNSAGINGEVTEGLGLTFPDAYLHADTMAKLSRALKEHDGAAFCELPFCHTVEAEAMGGLVNYGNDKTGPRAKEYICTKPEELLELQPLILAKEGSMKSCRPAGCSGSRASMWCCRYQAHLPS